MVDYRPENVHSAKAASQINCWEPVRGLAVGSSRDEYITAARASNVAILGISIATVASPGDAVAFAAAGRAKGIAGASLGAWTPVGANASGLLGPLTGAAAAPTVQQQVGISVQAGVAGQVITILVKPDQSSRRARRAGAPRRRSGPLRLGVLPHGE
jgi:uncharacterized protein with LGFP repeats